MTALLIILAAVPATLFPIFYLRRAWTATPVGRALMVKGIGNLILVDSAFAAVFIGPVPPVVRTVGAVFFVAGLWYVFLSLLRTPLKGERPD